MERKKSKTKIDSTKVTNAGKSLNNINTNEIVETKETDPIKEVSTDTIVKNTPVITPITNDVIVDIPSKKKKDIDMVKTSLRLSPAASALMKNKIEEKSANVNFLVNAFLEQIFDAENDCFRISIPKKDKVENITVPAVIPKNIAAALKNQAELRDMGIGEYFSELILKGLL